MDELGRRGAMHYMACNRIRELDTAALLESGKPCPQSAIGGNLKAERQQPLPNGVRRDGLVAGLASCGTGLPAGLAFRWDGLPAGLGAEVT